MLEVGAVLRATARALGRNATPIVVFTYGVSLLEAGVGQLVARSLSGDPSGVTIAGVVGLLVGLLASAFKTAAITFAIRARRKSHVPTIGECARHAVGRVPTLVVTSLLTMLAMLVGMLLLVVPGIYASLVLLVAVPVATMEDVGPVAALARSRALTSPHVGGIFLCNLLLAPVMFGGYVAAGIAQSMLSGEPFATAMIHVGTPTDVQTVILSSLAIGTMTAVTATYAAVLYGMLARKPRKPLGERVARVFE